MLTCNICKYLRNLSKHFCITRKVEHQWNLYKTQFCK